MSKILIAYFSCYGTTRKFAKEIQELGGDLYEIEPVIEYDGDMSHYEQLAEYAKKERDNDERPGIKSLPDISRYDYVFLGYPMWWYTYPQIIRTFIESLDFKGKTIIPFNTHEGSYDGGTYEQLRKSLPDSKILQGLAIRGGDMQSDQSKRISNWLERLGLDK